jgi:hypothetical protein
MFFNKYISLKLTLPAIEWAFVTFISVVGILGMILMYAPDNVICSLYWAGFWCSIAAGLIKYLGCILTERR